MDNGKIIKNMGVEFGLPIPLMVFLLILILVNGLKER
jgi:hypothetical protein